MKKFESDCFFYIIPDFRDPVPELSVVDRAAADACRYFFPPSIFPDRKVYQGARSACGLMGYSMVTWPVSVIVFFTICACSAVIVFVVLCVLQECSSASDLLYKRSAGHWVFQRFASRHPAKRNTKHNNPRHLQRSRTYHNSCIACPIGCRA